MGVWCFPLSLSLYKPLHFYGERRRKKGRKKKGIRK